MKSLSLVLNPAKSLYIGGFKNPAIGTLGLAQAVQLDELPGFLQQRPYRGIVPWSNYVRIVGMSPAPGHPTIINGIPYNEFISHYSSQSSLLENNSCFHNSAYDMCVHVRMKHQYCQCSKWMDGIYTPIAYKHAFSVIISRSRSSRSSSSIFTYMTCHFLK